MKPPDKPFDLLQRAAKIVWRTPSLWILGFIFALAGGSGVINLNFGTGFNYRARESSFETYRQPIYHIDRLVKANLPTIVLLAVIVALGIATVIVVINVVTTVALYRASDVSLREEPLPSWWPLLKGGWSHSAWHVFLADLIVWTLLFFIVLITVVIPILLLFLLLGGAPGVGMLFHHPHIAIAGLIIVGFVGILLLVVFILLLSAIVSLWKGLALRYIVLEEIGPVEALGRGWHLMWGEWRSIIGVWLLALAAAIGWKIIQVLTVGILAIIVGVTVGLVLLLSGQGFHFFGFHSWNSIVLLVALVVPLVILPALFLRGLYLAFDAVLWTDVFRRLTWPEWLQETPSAPDVEPVKGDYLPPRYV